MAVKAPPAFGAALALEYRRIVVPIVPGRPSDDALDVACRLAAERGARVVALTVIEVPLELPLDADLPEEERLANDELDATIEGIRDRYGPPPASLLNLAEYGRVRILADAINVETIDREGRMVVIRFRPNAKLDPMRLVKVVGGWPGAMLVPPVSVKLDVEAPLTALPSPPARPSGGKKAGKATRSDTAGSWWTARATTGEVRPGFSKQEILRRPESDPRAEGGMFSRLTGLLQALGGDSQSF